MRHLNLFFLILCGASQGFSLFSRQDDCSHESLSDDICCIGFDEDFCRGSRYEMKVGYQKLPWSARNDIESLICRRGCRVELYNHDGVTPEERGEKFIFDATKSQNHLYKNLEGDDELREMASAVNCSCVVQGAGYGDAFVEAAIRSVVQSNGGPQCRNIRFLENNACKLYDAADCQLDEWEAELNMIPGESRSFSRLQSWSNRQYRKAVRSVSVRRGCKLELYDGSSFDGEVISVAAPNQDTHVTLATNKQTTAMDQEAKSAKCIC